MTVESIQKPLKQALKFINDIQKKERELVRTNREWLDTIGGILPQSVITIVATSFGGKSTELENIKADIMDRNINPSADKYIWFSHSLEMTPTSTTLRDIRKLLKKYIKDILQNEFNEQEKQIVNNYYIGKNDGRFFVNYTAPTPEEFFASVSEFLDLHRDKEAVFIDIDHAALMKSSQDGKKSAIDGLGEYINSLKLKYENAYFIILSQLNRNLDTRIQEKSNMMRILRSDIYQSDTLFHLSDYLYGLQNASYLGVEQYRKINPEKYPHLEHRFTEEPDKNGKVSLLTERCIFVEILKDRTADAFAYIDLYSIEFGDFTKPTDNNKVQTPFF